MRATTALPNENAGDILLGSCTQYALQANPQNTQGTDTNNIPPAKKRII
jgi:hypothetical protein